MKLRERVIAALKRVANGTATIDDAQLLAAVACIEWNEVNRGEK